MREAILVGELEEDLELMLESLVTRLAGTDQMD